MGTQRIHISPSTNRRHCRVWRKQNEDDHAKFIQTTVKSPESEQVCEAISSRCISLERNVDGYMASAKYQSDIIHDIEIVCVCLSSYRWDISLYMVSRHAITLKVLEHSKNVKKYRF